DLIDEFDESYAVRLNSPVNATLGDPEGLGTIIDDDDPPTISINDVRVLEGNSGTTNAIFTVSLSAASGKVIAVNYLTIDGTAAAPGDYTSINGTLTFAAGELTKTLVVPVNGDTVREGDETFIVRLSNPS